MLSTIVIILLILLLIGALPTWPYSELGLRAWWRARHGACGCVDPCPIGKDIG